MTSENPAFNIGVLGAGQIAQAAHFAACRKARTAELYAICDAAEDLLGPDGGRFTSRTVTYTDYDKMLADGNIDAVIVAVADQFHVPLAIRALDAGKHVLVEKPMGTTVEEAEELAAGGRTQSARGPGRPREALRPGRRLRPRLHPGQDRRAHRPQALVLRLRLPVHHDRHPPAGHRNQRRRPPPAGNPKADRQRYLVLGHGSHLLDTARYLGGPLAAIRARLSTKAGTYCWFLEVDFENGCLGQLDLTIAVRMD